ncbi:MAG: archaetidylserine decarboxylase [Alicyclobacillaceae bacterium]|nr:archaetidylserine decarboxylase [Alicyclobacillaceae bacterium]
MQKIGQIGLRVIPKALMTYLLGKFAKTRMSRRWIPWYVRHYDINIWELDKEIHHYPTLHAFFCRGLHNFARPLADSGMVAPVDGTIRALGYVSEAMVMSVKGQSYALQDLLGDKALAAKMTGGQYIVFYLSPRDYHRIHIPYTSLWVAHRHIPGTLFPVNNLGEQYVRQLYAQNERVVSQFRIDHRADYVLVSVGAFGVGTVTLRHMPRIHPFHRRLWKATASLYQGSVEETRGEEFGRFELGSTVILLISSDFPVRWTVDVGQVVRMGQQIAVPN